MSSPFSIAISEVLPKNQKLLTIQSNTSVLDALKMLSAHNIYSAPVRDHAKGTYYGFLDMLDIVLILVRQIQEPKEGINIAKNFIEAVNSLNLKDAKTVADISATNPMVPLRSHDSLSEALKLFESTGTHRVPILSSDENNNQVADVTNILTQVDVITFLARNIQSLGANRKKTLKELHVQTKKVVSVEISTTTFDAFKVMTENKFTAVPIVNYDGTVFSNLSAKDIKEVKPEDLLLWMGKPTIEFIQMIRSKQINVSFPIFSCHLHNTLEEVVMKLSVLRVHRLYITDEHNHLIGVLSLGDLFKLLTSN